MGLGEDTKLAVTSDWHLRLLGGTVDNRKPKTIKCRHCPFELDIDEAIREWDKHKRNIWQEHIDKTGHSNYERKEETEYAPNN